MDTIIEERAEHISEILMKTVMANGGAEAQISSLIAENLFGGNGMAAVRMGKVNRNESVDSGLQMSAREMEQKG